MPDTTIKVNERNDPQVTVWINVLNPDKTVVPYDFTGAAIEFYLKVDTSDVDGSPICSTGLNTILIDTGSPWDENGVPIVSSSAKNRINILIPNSALPTGTTKFYRVDAIKSGKRETVIKGPFVIEDI